jgi:flavodoxin I
MDKIGLIYWPKGGNVEAVADIIVSRFDQNEIIKESLMEVDKDILLGCRNWIVGGSTVGSHVWEDATDSNKWFIFFKILNEINMESRRVAFFGLGDHVLYPHHYVDGLGTLQDEFAKRNARIVGQWPTTGYKFTESDGVRNGMFCGLALDHDNEPELTENRIDEWLKLILPEFKKPY